MLKSKRGFSLIEITVVIMIIGGILALAVPRMLTNKQDNRKVFRQIVVAVKEIRNRAKLYGTSYRLAFRLDEGQQAYWVEKSTTVTLIDKNALEQARKDAEDPFRKEEAAKTPQPFQPDPTFFKKEQVLPKDYKFISLESGSQGVTFVNGTAYIHFFPQGYIEPVLLQIEDPKKNIWTLVFNPITGQADIIAEAKTLQDLKR